MHKKGLISVSELVILSIVWGMCVATWRSIVIEGISAVAAAGFPRINPYFHDVMVGAVLIAVLFGIIHLSRNIDIGSQKVFELNNV